MSEKIQRLKVFDPTQFHKVKGNYHQVEQQLIAYLTEEERCLRESLHQAFAIPISPIPSNPPEEHPEKMLSATVRAVIDKINTAWQAGESYLADKQLGHVKIHVNAALRHYEEVLENVASQLFREIEEMRIDQINEQLVDIVRHFRDRVLVITEETLREVKRLEKKLSEHVVRQSNKWGFFTSIKRFFTIVLDLSILGKLKKIKTQVQEGCEQLERRFNDYRKWDEQARKRLSKLNGYVVFQSLSADSQQQFTEIYRLLKMRKMADKGCDLLQNDLIKILQDGVRTDSAAAVFREYFNALETELFAVCRELASIPDQELEVYEVRKKYLKRLRSHRSETHVLGGVVYQYRDFSLSTYPDPYIRARFGFVDHTVAQEPETTRDFLHLGHRIELLDQRYGRLSSVLEQFKGRQKYNETSGDIQAVLDDLEHLVRKAKTGDEALLYYQSCFERIESIQETFSMDPYLSIGMEKILRVALKLDNFNVLVEDRKFLEVYRIHSNLRGPVQLKDQKRLLDAMNSIARELATLRTDTIGWTQTAHTIAFKKIMDWKELSDQFFKNLEAFLVEQKARLPLPIDDLNGIVRIRRYEVLDFLYAYRSFQTRLKTLGMDTSKEIFDIFDKIKKIDGDFSYLSSHHGKIKGPMEIGAIRCWENL